MSKDVSTWQEEGGTLWSNLTSVLILVHLRIVVLECWIYLIISVKSNIMDMGYQHLAEGDWPKLSLIDLSK